MEEQYQYSTDTWDMLAERAVDWQEVDFVLRVSRPVLRRRVGEFILQITGLDRSNLWLRITLIELAGQDDTYVIQDVRYLDDEARKQADTTRED